MEDVATPTVSVESEPAPVVEPAAPTATEGSEPSTDAPQNTETTGSEPEDKAAKEIIRQRKRRQQAEQEAAYWRGKAEAAAQSRPEPPPVAKPVIPQTVDKPPALDQFETYEEYELAKDEYLLNKAEQRVTQKFTQHQIQKQKEAQERAFVSKLKQVADKDPTIYDIINDRDLRISTDVVNIIRDSDELGGILRWFNTNRDAAAQISELPPVEIAREIGRLEAHLKAAPKATPPKRVSAAPEPIKTVAPTGTVSEFNPETASYEEYKRHRLKEIYGI